jgi:uncharacterized protein with von Willebrand factor type A (vWA) domain
MIQNESSAHKMAVAFARILRGAGLDVPLDSVIVFVSALSQLGLENRNDVYWAAHSTLVRRHEDTPIFDRAFAVFWDQRIAIETSSAQAETVSMTLLVDDENEQDDNDKTAEPIDEENTITLRFSRIETLREKDFALYDDSELREAEQFMSSLRLAGPPKKSL